MNNKKRKNIKKIQNKPLNIFGLGGDVEQIGGALSGIANATLSNAQTGDTTGINTGINNLNNNIIDAKTNDQLMQQMNDLGYLNNVKFSDVRGGSTGQRLMGTLGATTQGVTAGAKVGGPVGAIIGGATGLLSGVGGWITGDAKARKQVGSLNNQIKQANLKRDLSFDNAIGNVDNTLNSNLLANYAAFGGQLNNDDFSNGVQSFEEGDTHENNPLGGIPMGIDPQGIPNLVEEGEVKWEDYIFSNRQKPTKKALEDMKLNKKYSNNTFAELAKKFSKESEERPNDPISKNGLDDFMNRLKGIQEAMNQEKEQKQQSIGQSNMFKDGGLTKPNFLFPKTNPLNLEFQQPDISYQQSLNRNNPYQSFLNSDEILQKPQLNSSQSTQDLQDPQEETGIKNAYTDMRYAPIVGSGISALTDLFGITNKPDYTTANMVGDSVKNLSTVDYNPVGNYLTYNPLDRNYYANKLNAQSGAVARDIVNASGGNRATAAAGLLAADYNAGMKLGNLNRQAEEYNLNQRQQIEAFNRQTNLSNSQGLLQADQINKQNDELRMRAQITKAQMMNQEDTISAQAKSANLTNLFDSLGAVGSENYMRNMINNNPALYYYLTGKGETKKKKNGGYLTIKNK